MNAQEARRALWLADSRAYYAHRRWLELRTQEARDAYEAALRDGDEAQRALREAEGDQEQAS